MSTFPKEPGPIGVFDSGYGGLTVLSEIQQLLPQYDYIYLGDNARTPYGTRSFETIYEYTREAVYYLFQQGCHLVILACNTASAKALRSIQQKDLPLWDSERRVLGVIRPSVESIPQLSQTKEVGILGTVGTVNSQSYPLEINKLFPSTKVFQQACPLWVPLIENGLHETPGAAYFVEHDIQQLLQQSQNIDTVILGCTHYPLILSLVKKYLPKHVQAITQGSIVAKSLQDYLIRRKNIEAQCSKGATTTFLTTEQSEKFNSTAKLFVHYPTHSQSCRIDEVRTC